MSQPTLLADYLEKTLGVHVPVQRARLRGLPLYLAHAYRLWKASLFGRDFLLAEVRVDTKPPTPRLAADLRALRTAAPESHVAVVLRHATRAQRKRLVCSQIPFIVPGSQMYLPSTLVDLRERFPREPRERPSHLTAAAQLVLLRHLLRGDAEGRPLATLARDYGYSAMTLSNVRDELIAAELCIEHVEGRSRPLQFRLAGRELWDHALPLLRTPVQETVHVGVMTRNLRVLDAGLTGLARHTMLASPPVATVATSRSALRRALKDRDALIRATEDEPARQVQAWSYDPFRLSQEDVVDPLSLWLSLRDDQNERVQGALAQLLESVPW